MIVRKDQDRAALPALKPWFPVPVEQGRGKVSRYAWGDDYHDLLRTRVNMLAAWLQERVPGLLEFFIASPVDTTADQKVMM